MFDVACISIFYVLCISVLMLNISLRLAGLNIYFCLFLTKKWVQNWVHRYGFFFTMGLIESAPDRSILYYFQSLGKLSCIKNHVQGNCGGYFKFSEDFM